jgi:hypothetical protein
MNSYRIIVSQKKGQISVYMLLGVALLLIVSFFISLTNKEKIEDYFVPDFNVVALGSVNG